MINRRNYCKKAVHSWSLSFNLVGNLSLSHCETLRRYNLSVNFQVPNLEVISLSVVLQG